MKLATKDYVINTVFRTNILPVISQCNTACVFCSHKQNPEGIEVFGLQNMNLEDFAEIINFLSGDKKIVVGESASRIIEGEPLLHKDFIAVLTLIRKKFKHTAISVTTNGILLDKALIDKMVELGNIELNISVNCIDPLKRSMLLGLGSNANIEEKIHMVKGRLKFSGSFVMVPEISRKDAEDIIALLDECGADSVRLFLPGYTSRAKRVMGMEHIPDFFEMLEDVHKLVDELRERYAIPLIIEPSYVSSLECRIEGVIRGTPASNAGMKTGDVILGVNGNRVKTRVEGFNRTFRLRNPALEIKRGDELLNLRLAKERNTSPGFIVLYDIDPCIIEQVAAAVERNKARNVLFITSELAGDVLAGILEKEAFDFVYDIIKAPNAFFGGTIKCAGLLTVQDILDSAGEYLKNNKRPDLILLPPAMFGHTRRDLTGRSMKEVEEQLNIAVDTT